ncbi:UNVERIFIED_CONTAM: hypothetical protein FKN15_020342 [Acipenser sinensis]
MGRKSCKKQQKRRQQQQLPPGDVGPRYVVDERCPGCGEFGHTMAICPTQYQEEEGEPEPQPQEEDGWEALLCSMGVPYWPTMQPPQRCSVGGQRSSGQLTGKPAGVAGAWGTEDTLADLGPPPSGWRSANCAPHPGNCHPRSAVEYPGLEPATSRL